MTSRRRSLNLLRSTALPAGSAFRHPRSALLRQTALSGGVLAAMLVLAPAEAQAQGQGFFWSGDTNGVATLGGNWFGGTAPQAGNGNAEITVNGYTILPPTFGAANYAWRSLTVNLTNRVDPVADTVFLTGTSTFGDPGVGVIFNAYVTSGRLEVGSNVSLFSLTQGSVQSGRVEVRDNGTLYNRGMIAKEVRNSGSITNYATGTIGSHLHPQAVSNTRGTVDVYGRPNLAVGVNGEKAGFINYGTITSQHQLGGATSPNSERYSVSNSGYFQNGVGGIIERGAESFGSSGYFENQGTINGLSYAASGTFSNGALVTTFDINGNIHGEGRLTGTLANIAVAGGTFQNYGGVTGTVTQTGGVANNLGSIHRLALSGGVFNNAVRVINDFPGQTPETLTGSITDRVTQTGGTLNNRGSLAGTTDVNGGLLDNQTGGTIASLSVAGTQGGASGSATNTGVITSAVILAGGSLTNRSGGSIGSVNNGGTFVNESGSTVTGNVGNGNATTNTITSANFGTINGVLTVNNGIFMQAGALVGAAVVNGGTLIFGGPNGQSYSDGDLAANLRGAGGTFLNNGRIAFNAGVNTGTVTIASVISGTGVVEQRSSNGHTILTGDNTYTGKTVVTAGRLQISGASASNEFEVNGTLTLNRDTNTSFTGTVTGGGGFFKGGAGTMTLDSNLQNTGTVGVLAGSLSIGTGSIAAAATIATSAGATFDLGSAARTVGGISGQGGTVSGTGTITIDAATGTISQYNGVISGPGRALVKTGAGQQELYGANSFGGGVTINGGVLKVGSEAAIGAGTATVAVAAGASLGLGNQVTTPIVDFNFGIVITGAGGLIKTSGNTVTLTGANTYTGTTRVEAGTLKLGVGGSLSAQSALVVLAGATFDVGAANQTVGSLSGVGGTVAGTGNLVVQLANDEVVTGNPLSGFASFDKQGAQTLSLTGNLNYAGQVTISGGTLVLSGANTLTGGITVNGTLSLGASGAAGGAANTITTTGSIIDYADGVDINTPIAIDSQTTQLRVTTGTATQSGVISELLVTAPLPPAGEGRPLEKIGAGTLILSAANTYTGVTTISAGALNIRNATGLGTTAAGTVVAAGAALELEGGVTIGAEALTLNGTGVANGGALRNVAGSNVYGGAITLGSATTIVTNGVRLDLNGAIALGANNLTLGGTGWLLASGSISGAGGLIIDSAGIVGINTANTYTGGTTLTQGDLEVAAGATLGAVTGAVTVNGGRLLLNGALTIGSLAGTGGVVTTQGGAARVLTVDGAATTAYSGALQDNGAGALKALFTGGGTTTLSGANTLTGGIEIAGTGTRVNFATLASTGGAANTVTLAGTNTVLGLTAPTNSNYLNPIALTGTGAKIDVGANDYTQSGVISGTSGFEKLGTGTLILGDTMVNPTHTYSGATTISAGTVRFRSTANLGNDGATNRVVLNGGKLETAGNVGIAMARPVEITALGGTLDNAVELTLNGATTFTGALTKTGAGKLTLNGAGTGAGGLIFNSSNVLEVGSNTALGTGTLRLQNGGTLTPGVASVSLANAVVLDAATFVSTPTGRAMTLSGAISGAGSINKTNLGILDLTGANSFTGGVTLGGGTLGVGSNTALGTGRLSAQIGTTLRAVANATLANNIEVTFGMGGTQFTVDTNGNNLTLNGVISTTVPQGEQVQPGLTKTGAGVLTLNGVNTYRGPTIINAGTLVVNGSINASSGITIAQGATLGGNGATPTLTVQGTISPGNSVGVLNINGGLTLASTATTVIEIEGATADRINVTGNAALAGTLQLVAAGGAYVFATPYTILTATGARTGTFATITTVGSFGVGVTSAVTYGANNVQVTLTAAPLVTVAPAAITTTTTTASGSTTTTTVIAQQAPVLGFRQTRNITAVAAALDRASFAGADVSSLFRIYNQPTREALAAAINTLSGEVHTASAAIGQRVSDQFLRVMLDPTAIGRDGSLVGIAGPAGFTADLPGRKGPVSAPAPMRLEPNYRVWGATFGGVERVEGDAVTIGSADRRIKDLNLAVGADLRVAPGTVVGFALAGGRAHARLSGDLGTAEADVFQAGLYGATRIGRLDLAASGAYSALDVETRRSIPALGQGPRGDYRLDVWGGRLEAAYEAFSAGGFTLSPLAALQAQAVRTPGFREINVFTGAGVGVVGENRTNTTLRTELGVKLSHQTLVGGRKVALFTQIAWAHYAIRDAQFAAGIAGVAGSSFVVQGARPDRDAALLAAGADIHLAPNLVLSGRLDATLSRNVRGFGGNAALRASF